ncbi:MAG: hypothetical protein HFJ17_06055, partial [Clostridia bacterium]|nr:hypothetical protein [Clostridia bacterium]
MFNAIFNAEKTENNLQEFKKWLDAEMQEETAATDLRNYVSSIQYQYNVTLNTYVQNADGEYINTDLSKAFMAATGSSDEEEANPMYSMMSSRMTGYIGVSWRNLCFPAALGELELGGKLEFQVDGV